MSTAVIQKLIDRGDLTGQEARAATIRRLRMWSRGLVTASLEGRAVVVFAHGTR